MIIEDRLFSENTGETLYSILLSEKEYSLSSKKTKINNNINQEAPQE